MAVTYTTAAKNARMQAIADLIDAGASPGKLKIRNAANTVLATFTLTDPCAESVAGGVLTFDFNPDISDSSADATGTADNAIFTDSADTTVISGLSVGTSGTDVVLDSVSITAGQTVTILTAAITHA
jgi:hypothetical protein